MLIDSHCHIFTPRIVENMQSMPELVTELGLNARDAWDRLDPRALQESAERNHVDLCLLLPSTGPDRVRAENDRFIGFCKDLPRLRTLATLHPHMRDPSEEIRRMRDTGVAGFKFSSFSQRFDPSSSEMARMLSEIQGLWQGRSIPPVAVFDTFVRADSYFRAKPEFLTTPKRLADLAERFPAINFIAAHMGGLLADFDEIRRDLPPAPNLWLDTSNAAHTLRDREFVELLRIHGPDRVLFGTDWPWFVHRAEAPKIHSLMEDAGWGRPEQDAVFGLNAVKLFGF